MSLTSEQILQREFLDMRAKLLEVAASMDRIDRATGDVDDDLRMVRIHRALDILGSREDARAEKLQMLFSRAYKEDWRREFGM